ncbi:hypothetical protein [Halomarina pelagica]|uniref:hypothetical protein n=1 Tax=Halomarina pelagica TaxID=2961599 RepID=UPI0020C30A46|nr:hypothetical protein [Halomarina sp. BND7]
MPRLRFETADSAERTQIGEGLVRFAVQAGRLDAGREDGKYFLDHADGCGVDGKRIRPGDPFVFDTDTGDVLCADHADHADQGDHADRSDRGGRGDPADGGR